LFRELAERLKEHFANSDHTGSDYAHSDSIGRAGAVVYKLDEDVLVDDIDPK
jgi:hypothetical protein